MEKTGTPIRTMYDALDVHPTTDPDNPRSWFAVARFEKQLRELIHPGMRALDLGCNAGRFTFAMETMGALAVGIDFASVPLRHARAVAERRGSRSQFHVGDITALPYKPNSFDVALLPNNIGYLSYQALEEMSVQLQAVLADTGMFVVTMHDELIKRAGEATLPERYDAETGLIRSETRIPDKGVYPSPWYFWTVACATHILAKYFLLERIEQVAENRFLLVCRNSGGRT